MICQLIYARSNPAFSFKKNNNGEIHFKTDDAAGLGWYNVSEKLLKDYVWLIEASEGFSVDKIRSVSRNSSENVSEVNSSYTCLKLKDDVFALIYQFTQNDSRATSVARHILIGTFPVNITHLLSKELPCWKATQGPEVNFYDKNADRERLPALDDSFLSGHADSEQEIFDFINKNSEFYKKILCFLIEHLSNADGLNKTLLIRDTQENMILWVKAISYFLPLELRKNFTFSTNITELYEEQQSRLSDVKNNNRLYFAVAGIHPEDRSCAGIAEETKMYSLADIGKGRFTYSHEYLNCSFFEDLLIRGKISSFYYDIWSKINKKINVVEYYEIYSNKEKLHSLGYEKVRRFFEILNKNRDAYSIFEKDIFDAAGKIYDNLGDDVEKNLPLLFALQDYNHKFDVCDVIKKFVCSQKDGKFISYETAKRLFTGDTSVLPHISKDKLKGLFNNFAYGVLKNDISYLKQDLKEKFVLFNVVVAHLPPFRESVSKNLKEITQEYVKNIKQLTQLISNTPEDYKKAVYEAFAENIQQNNDAKYAWIKTSLTNEDTYKILVRIDSQTKDRQTKFDLKQAILEYQGYIVKNSDENGKEIDGFLNKIKETSYLLSYLPDLKKNLIAKIPGINRNLKTDFLVDYFCNYRKEAGNLTKDDKEKEDGFIRHIFSKSGEKEKENYAEKIKEAAPDKKDLLKKIFLNKQLPDLIDKKNYAEILEKIQKDKDSAEFFFNKISSKTEFYDKADLDILNNYLEDVYIKYAKKDKKVICPEAIQLLLRRFEALSLKEFFKVLNRLNKNLTLDGIYDKYSNPSVKIFEHCEAYSECIKFFSGADENYVKIFCENLCDYVVKQPDDERLRIFHSCYEAVRNVKCGEEKGEKIFENALRGKYISRIENPDENRWTKIFNGIREYLINIDDKHSQEYVDEHLKYLNNTFRKKEAKEKLLKSLLKQIKKFK